MAITSGNSLAFGATILILCLLVSIHGNMNKQRETTLPGSVMPPLCHLPNKCYSLCSCLFLLCSGLCFIQHCGVAADHIPSDILATHNSTGSIVVSVYGNTREVAPCHPAKCLSRTLNQWERATCERRDRCAMDNIVFVLNKLY